MKIRMFKVYAWKQGVSALEATRPDRNPDHDICFASSPRMAAGIVQSVWHETGFECERFRVVEMAVPECAQEGQFMGLIYEPEGIGLVECGCCGCFHRRAYTGDCRNDAERFPTPDPAVR
jgi:hypothetical protein